MSQILKEYTPRELEEVSKNYALVSVQDSSGKKIISWTPSNKTIKAHLAECMKRLGMEIYPDGFYYFCFAQNRRASTDNYDKYLFKKGNPRPEVLHHQLSDNKPQASEMLSLSSALGYITKIAELTTEANSLKAENQRLKDENAVLDAECEELSKGLNDNGEAESGTMQFLKDAQPGIMGALDRYFTLQEKKLSLQEKSLQGAKKIIVKRPTVTHIPGSNEHLDYIRKLHKDNQLQLMDKEIDKLEGTHPEQYELICKELNLFEDESGNS